MKFAFFDFDDTLSRGDSILPYLVYCIRRGYAPWSQLPRAIRAYVRWLMHPETASGCKEFTLTYIRGQSQQEMDALAREFFRSRGMKRVYADGAAALNRLRSEGYRIVVVSASAEVYMRVLPEFLPVDAVLATRCPLDDRGCYTGEIGENCKGEEKPRRIAEYLAQQGFSFDAAASCAYGDSPSDAPMLRMTGKPMLVNPKKKLRAALPDAPCLRWK